MRLNYILVFALLGFDVLYGQLNATLVSNFDYSEQVNDVWGYVSPDGTEYAIVGLETGVSVVSLADAANPVEVGRTTGDGSPWRDMKTYGQYAYVTADRGSDGLTVIDLTMLPQSISFKNNLYEVPGFTPLFRRAHNIYIDTVAGLAFTAGGNQNVNSGGMLIFDLNTDPLTPELIAVGPAIYSHDVYVRDSFMYASEIFRKDLAIYNIADLQNIREVGRTRTPFGFTHNAWPSDGGGVVFTTDELPNASVAAFDVSNLDDLRLLDEYRPLTSLNTNTIPHNVHVIGYWLSISYYTDGLRVVDAADPTNLIEVANYDTWPGVSGDYNGNWGAYPYLPSGLTLVSDRQTGLYVVDVNYKRAARVAGTVSNAANGQPINEARVELLTEQLAYDRTAANGRYATGVAEAGTTRIAVSKSGFVPDTITVNLIAGETVTVDLQLQPRLRTTLRVTVLDTDSGAAIPGAVVQLDNAEFTFTGGTDQDGVFEIADVYDVDYDFLVSAWGFRPKVVDLNITESTTSITVALSRGYEDIFASDLGWTVSGDATGGEWERGIPEAMSTAQQSTQSGTDAGADYGDRAYITGLAAHSPGNNDVDGGITVLASPLFDLSDYPDSTTLSYYYYYVNVPRLAIGSDSMTVSIDNGNERVNLAAYRGGQAEWMIDTFLLTDFLALTDSMQLFVTVGAQRASEDIIEAGFDYFRILRGTLSTGTKDRTQLPMADVIASPNPSALAFDLSYDLGTAYRGTLEVYSIMGQRVLQFVLGANAGAISFGDALAPGTYLARITPQGGDRRPRVIKLIKQ